MKDTIISDLATNKIGFPTDITSYLVNMSSVKFTVTKASAIGVTPLKAWNRVRGLKIKKNIKVQKETEINLVFILYILFRINVKATNLCRA